MGTDKSCSTSNNIFHDILPEIWLFAKCHIIISLSLIYLLKPFVDHGIIRIPNASDITLISQLVIYTVVDNW